MRVGTVPTKNILDHEAWQQAIGRNVTIATFDLRLWQAALEIGLLVFPNDLPSQIASDSGVKELQCTATK